MSYLIAKPSEYIVITGRGIDDVKLAKKGWVYPLQSSWKFDISPMNYTFDVQAMSIEKLPFTLPAVFTIGPRDDEESLTKYAKLIATHDMSGRHVTELLKGIIEGETRVLAAGMTMEEVFKGAEYFKQEVFDKVQVELDQFGLNIYNANIKQLVDIPGQEYFSYLGQKTQHEAANQAKVDVAEAKYKGDKGAKEREGLTLRNAAKVNAETKIFAKAQSAAARQQEVKVTESCIDSPRLGLANSNLASSLLFFRLITRDVNSDPPSADLCNVWHGCNRSKIHTQSSIVNFLLLLNF